MADQYSRTRLLLGDDGGSSVLEEEIRAKGQELLDFRENLIRFHK